LHYFTIVLQEKVIAFQYLLAVWHIGEADKIVAHTAETGQDLRERCDNKVFPMTENREFHKIKSQFSNAKMWHTNIHWKAIIISVV
jgi:hypothetical protein